MRSRKRQSSACGGGREQFRKTRAFAVTVRDRAKTNYTIIAHESRNSIAWTWVSSNRTAPTRRGEHRPRTRASRLVVRLHGPRSTSDAAELMTGGMIRGPRRVFGTRAQHPEPSLAARKGSAGAENLAQTRCSRTTRRSIAETENLGPFDLGGHWGMKRTQHGLWWAVSLSRTERGLGRPYVQPDKCTDTRAERLATGGGPFLPRKPRRGPN